MIELQLQEPRTVEHSEKSFSPTKNVKKELSNPAIPLRVRLKHQRCSEDQAGFA